MTTFNTSRQIPASPAEVFAAFENPARLAKWWGPDGFSNTFEVCDFKPGGTWRFTMHGTDGKNYLNECEFLEVERDQKVVIQHASLPRFRLTVTLSPSGAGTLLTWSQTLEDPVVAEAVRHIVVPANEQNLDRLVQELGVNKHPGV
jgi:uncharacterized protein YndB with AHSA1/START domain